MIRTDVTPGSRVVAIRNVDEYGRCFVYGHGMYEGLFLIGDEEPSGIRIPTFEEKTHPFYNPRIRLDNGKYMWGFRCTWVSEMMFHQNPPYEEIIVDIEP